MDTPDAIEPLVDATVVGKLLRIARSTVYDQAAKGHGFAFGLVAPALLVPRQRSIPPVMPVTSHERELQSARRWRHEVLDVVQADTAGSVRSFPRETGRR
jgi:hypothetical protein